MSILRCTGNEQCEADIHYHGCYADVPPAVCDDPDGHRPRIRCTCRCHTTEGMMHVAACCSNGWRT